MKIRKKALGARGIPYLVTHDGRTIPYPDPEISVADTIQYDFIKGKVLTIIYFRVGSVCMVTGGKNIGRVGIMKKLERHPGSFDVVHITDAKDHTFATRKDNIFMIGVGAKAAITLPKTKGIKYTILEDREFRLKRMQAPVPNQNKKKELSGKGGVLPPASIALRKQAKERKRLLAILRAEERKQMRNQPQIKGKKK